MVPMFRPLKPVTARMVKMVPTALQRVAELVATQAVVMVVSAVRGASEMAALAVRVVVEQIVVAMVVQAAVAALAAMRGSPAVALAITAVMEDRVETDPRAAPRMQVAPWVASMPY